MEAAGRAGGRPRVHSRLAFGRKRARRMVLLGRPSLGIGSQRADIRRGASGAAAVHWPPPLSLRGS